MAKYELSEEKVKNLSVFLARVQLQGQEVAAFNGIINALNSPIEEKDDNKSKSK